MVTPIHSSQGAQEDIRVAWRLSCMREGIDPQSPSALPTLFALDSDLNIPDGSPTSSTA
ncbi:hypothetical protein R50071_01410 [Halioxenophilus aromaticivorans]